MLNSNFWADSEQKKKDRLRVADIAFKAKKVFINEAIPNLFGQVELFRDEIEVLKEEAMKIEVVLFSMRSYWGIRQDAG